MSRTLIIGYGNPLRQDDGVAWHVVERLNETTRVQDPDAQTLLTHQLTPDLADELGRADRVLLIDASDGAGAVGIRMMPVEPAVVSPGSFSHHVDPGVLLTLAAGLYGRCPDATALIVTGACFGYGESLSPAVAALVPAIVSQVQAWRAAPFALPNKDNEYNDSILNKKRTLQGRQPIQAFDDALHKGKT